MQGKATNSSRMFRVTPILRVLVCAALGLFVALACSAPEKQLAPQVLQAYQTPRSIRFCSQNLQRYGERNARWSHKKEQEQERYLLRRMRDAKCDILAVQEVVGGSRREARARLETLAKQLSAQRAAPFMVEVGGSRDRFIRNAFLFRSDLFEVRRSYDLSIKALPRIQNVFGPSGNYSRGPLLLHLRTRDKATDILVATMHFKSKSGGFRDPSGTDFEIRRMESAEGLRRALRVLLDELPPETVLVLGGDRNSGPTSASAAILEGRRQLAAFEEGSCELDQQERPRCAKQEQEAELLALFSHSERVEGRRLRSHSYRGRSSLIDELLIRPRDLWRLRDAKGRLRIGVEGEYFKGSDHRLLWAELQLRAQ